MDNKMTRINQMKSNHNVGIGTTHRNYGTGIDTHYFDSIDRKMAASCTWYEKSYHSAFKRIDELDNKIKRITEIVGACEHE